MKTKTILILIFGGLLSGFYVLYIMINEVWGPDIKERFKKAKKAYKEALERNRL